MYHQITIVGNLGRYWAVATSPEEAHQRYMEVWDGR